MRSIPLLTKIPVANICGSFLLLVFILPPPPLGVFVESFSFGTATASRLLDFLRPPSSTKHLADLLELYDVVQDPEFLATSSSSSLLSSEAENWRCSSFRRIIADVEVTSRGVVEGKGLIARRDFSAGEVVALYPIHAIGFSHGKSPPRSHDRTERVYPSITTSTTITGSEKNGIVGTSDLLYFEEESHVFGGDDQDDFSFTMTDPSGKYVFDVNPERFSDPNRRRISARGSLNTNSSTDTENNPITAAVAAINSDDLFVAHYVNDASFADFSSVVNGAKALRKQQQQQSSRSNGDTDIDNLVQKGKELDDAAARLAVDYLGSSTGTTATAGAVEQRGFNVVMCGFGPPPLMAYVTTRSVRQGEEFLASYGLGYWLGKAFPDEDDAVLDAALAALDARREVRQAQTRADDAVEAALDAGDRAVQTKYRELTQLIRDTFAGLRRDRRRRQKERKREDRSPKNTA